MHYQFKKRGIVFISLRLGLYNLGSSYYNFIPSRFSKFTNNLGFVGGKKDSANYFIGMKGDNKLIFTDPQVNQKTKYGLEKDNNFYFT